MRDIIDTAFECIKIVAESAVRFFVYSFILGVIAVLIAISSLPDKIIEFFTMIEL